MPQEHLRLTAMATAMVVLGLIGVPTSQAACGGNVLLGAANSCNGTTGLTGVFNSPLVTVTNTGTGSAADAIVGNAKGGAGVRGITTGTGPGVEGISNTGIGVRGSSSKGTGVVGAHTTATGTNPGVQGTTSATVSSAAGVVGRVVPTAPGGFSAGVRGINNGTGGLGIGVWGEQAGGGWGVFGEAPSGIGVRGESTSGTGVAAANNGSAPALSATNQGSGPAAEFNASGAPFTVNSSTRVDNLNADQLDGRSANEFGRTAVAAVISYNSDGTFAERASITIDAPTAGLMLVSGSVSIDTLLGGATSSCDPCLGVMRLRDKLNSATSTEQAGTFGNGTDEASTQLATNWVFQVSAGRRMFALDTNEQPNDVFADNPTLTALFVPFGPSGVAAAAAVSADPARAGRR